MSDMSQLEQSASKAAALLKSMSNESRLMILCSLLDQEMSVGDLNEVVPLSQSALSQHLAALRKSELLSTRRDAQTIFYRLNSEAPRKIISVLKEIYCPEK